MGDCSDRLSVGHKNENYNRLKVGRYKTTTWTCPRISFISKKNEDKKLYFCHKILIMDN